MESTTEESQEEYIQFLPVCFIHNSCILDLETKNKPRDFSTVRKI